MEPGIKWQLAKYARWDEGEWKLMLPDDGQPLFLLLQNLQLFVILGKTATESVCLAQSKPNIKCSYNNGTLVISVMSQDMSSKFRVLFSSHFDGEKCIYELKKYIDVCVAEGSRPVLDKSQETYATILAKILKKQNHLLPVPQSIPDEYPLEDAITLCILDPGFPALVEKVQNIIKSSEDKSNK